MCKFIAGIALCTSGFNAIAALSSDAVLTISSDSYFVYHDKNTGFPLTISINGGYNGLHLGTTQLASGSHSGRVNGTESPNIDIPWEYFSQTGMHQTTSDTTVLSSYSNMATLDFSGWSWDWYGLEVDFGSGAWGDNADGVAEITCSVDCSYGDAYELYYTATVPTNDPIWSNAQYSFHLFGKVFATVPIPSAIWLFGSALIGLIGLAGRKKS